MLTPMCRNTKKGLSADSPQIICYILDLLFIVVAKHIGESLLSVIACLLRVVRTSGCRLLLIKAKDTVPGCA